MCRYIVVYVDGAFDDRNMLLPIPQSFIDKDAKSLPK